MCICVPDKCVCAEEGVEKTLDLQNKTSTFSFSERPNRSSRMRSGWIKGFLVVLVLVLASLYLSNIKTQVYTHSERLQKAHHNETIRGQMILGRMDKMQENINRLSESTFSLDFIPSCTLCRSEHQILSLRDTKY